MRLLKMGSTSRKSIIFHHIATRGPTLIILSPGSLNKLDYSIKNWGARQNIKGLQWKYIFIE